MRTAGSHAPARSADLTASAAPPALAGPTSGTGLVALRSTVGAFEPPGILALFRRHVSDKWLMQAPDVVLREGCCQVRKWDALKREEVHLEVEGEPEVLGNNAEDLWVAEAVQFGPRWQEAPAEAVQPAPISTCQCEGVLLHQQVSLANRANTCCCASE